MYIPNVKYDEIPEGMLREVYECWVSLKTGKNLPSKDDLISSSVISGYLPHLVLAKVYRNPINFKAQMVGSQIIAALGFNPTGFFATEFKLADEIFQRGRTLAETKEPYLASSKLEWAKHKDIQCYALALPLFNDKKTVDLVLLVMKFNKF